MKKNIITFFWLAVILFGIFFLIKTAIGFYSSTAAYQTINDTSTNIPALGYRVQGITSSTDNIFVNQTWKLKIRALVNNRIQVNFYWNAGANGAFIDFLTDGTVISSSSPVIGLTKDSDFYTISYSAFQPTGDVFIQFRSLVASSDVYGTNTNNYEEGEFCDGGNNPYTNPCNDGGLTDAYFVFSESGEPPPADSIEITYPTSTPPYDFSNWIVAFTTATSTTATSTDFYLKDIYMGLTTSTVDNLAGLGGSGESPQEINNMLLLSPNTTYYSQAVLSYYKYEIQVVATSSIVSFTTSNLTESELSIYPIPTSTATSSEWVFTCDPESGFFQNSLCNLARFLFVPTSLSVRNLTDLKEEIELKPPIGYFNLIKDALSNIHATGTPAFTLAGIEDLETDFFDKIKDILAILFYIIFGFWLLKRIINFDFQI